MKGNGVKPTRTQRKRNVIKGIIYPTMLPPYKQSTNEHILNMKNLKGYISFESSFRKAKNYYMHFSKNRHFGQGGNQAKKEKELEVSTEYFYLQN